MADEDSGSDIEEYASMEQPPLIDQLKTILAEYPDDGQIIKELLQNAEDAGADEVKMLFDERCINAQEDKKNKYRKFLRGPAFCFFNDATFTESDWKGIKRIYSSNKKEDPLKVGRFGLGFKSVFHITDYPVVLSGDRIMFMDPHRNPDYVCLSIQLSKLKKWKKLNIDDFFLALDGTFGVSREVLEMGMYNGTLFWFPLRSKASSLSDTIYNREKVMDLFTSFRTEAPGILVFLNHLTKVALHVSKNRTTTINPQFTVEIVNNGDEIREIRKTFMSKIKNLNKSIPKMSIDCRYRLLICTKSFDGDRVIEEIINDWKVINYYKGGSMSDELRALIQDDPHGYCPLVGVAAPMGQNRAEFKGHVYCFLPLPQRTKSMTGLPVHVNGFFALSQNRRHIKWPSAEQDAMHLHKDKSFLWNEKLLMELLPDVYEILITEMINDSIEMGNPDDLVQSIYATIPTAEKVIDQWNDILPAFFIKMISRPALMNINISGDKSWIHCSDAFFATFCKYPNLSPTVRSTLVKVLQLYDKKYVDVPHHLLESFMKFNNQLTDMNPQSFASVLKEDPRYKSLSRQYKLDILEFLLLDSCYEILDGLELLPLHDASFITFASRDNASDQAFLCRMEEIDLFPGLEKKFVYQGHQNQCLREHMQAIVKQGLYQVYVMDDTTFQRLLEKTIEDHIGPIYPPKVESFSILSGSWIEKIWGHIFSNGYDVRKFDHIPLIPLLKSGSSLDVKGMELYRLTDFLIVKQMQNIQRFRDSVYICLELLSIKVLPSLPLWLQKEQILMYIQYSTEFGLITLLGRLFNSIHRENIISNFNRSDVDKEEFIKCLSGCKEWPSDSLKFAKRLKLFRQSGPENKTVSIQENNIFTNAKEYPVKFPRPFLIGSHEECLLARILGATELDRRTLITETLKMMQAESYNFSERQSFMHYIMQHMREFENDENIMCTARSIAFLKSNLTHSVCTPADLFDPSDSRLLELFQGENRFPEENLIQTDTDIMTLKKLGLKTYNNVTEIELYETARLLETWCNSENDNYMVQKKAKRFLEVLKDKSTILHKLVQGCALNELIMELRCILNAEATDQNFTNILPWFQQQKKLSKPSELRLLKYSRLVGSTMPLIDCQNQEVAEMLRWNIDPPIDKVVEQLRMLIDAYKNCYKPEMLSIINEIYINLSKYTFTDICANKNFQSLLQRGCIWRGDGFSPPQEIYIQSRKTDLDLTPYLHKLPKEFKELRFFFLKLGCNKEQNFDVLLKTQISIKEKYSSGQYSHDIVKRDLSVLISILNKMRQEKGQLNERLHEILFPIHCKDVTTIVMKPGPECTFCNAKWLREMTTEDEESIFYVHEDVSNMTAEELGVKSLTQQLLSDTEELAIEECGQEESLTTRLHRLLKEGYQDGFSVPKEIVQNADDAGAKTVYFLYDERENEDAKNNLLDEGMAECQGPAFWAYNDAQFQEKDYKNIAKLNGATKEDELDKIGKFGLGFCSVYNLTDVPSFISGSNIVILDPHKSHLGKALPGSSPGMRIDFKKMKNLTMMKRLQNQFKPFQNVFGCNISSDFQGTLFRFPLRTAFQAQRSEISNKYYSKKECQELLLMTIQAAGNLLLFTQHIQKIKIFHLPMESKDPIEAKLVFSLTKEPSPGLARKPNEENILEQASKLKISGDLKYRPLNRLQNLTIKEKLKPYAASILPSLEKEAGMRLNTSWLISWATGTDLTLTQAFNDVAGTLPLCAVAVPYEMRDNQFIPMQLKDLPFGFYTSGHLFCFLPLPISSGLPVHVNGCFAVTSDRRQLMKSTEDDKKSQRSSWNEALIGDALVNAYILLLEGIRENKPPLEYNYYSLWPLKCQTAELPIIKHFFIKLVQLESRLFHHNLHWQSFSKCVFLDPSLRNERIIGEIAFETMQFVHSDGTSVVMDLPDEVLKNLKALYPDELMKRIVSKEHFFLSVFFPNIEKEFWGQSMASIQKRDKLVMYALRLGEEAVNVSMSITRCIPSEPNGTLKCPTELVNPLGNLRDLFSDDEEVFPRGKKTFRQPKIVELLVGLGMLDDYMPFTFLEDRCKSIITLAQTCGQCAIDRCSRILKYLSGYSVQEKLEKNQNDLQKIRNIPFLPALQKPSQWHFSWKENIALDTIKRTCHVHCPSRTVKLDASTNLFRKGTENLVGCVELVLDETSLASAESSIYSFDVCAFLQLRGLNRNDVPYNIVVKQLKTIAEEYKENRSGHKATYCKIILYDIYLFLDEACEKSEEIRNSCSKDLLGDEVLLLGNQMLDSSRVALSLRHNCSPTLFGLQNTELAKYRYFLKAIGTKEHFEVQDILTILCDKRRQWGQKSLSEKKIDLVHGLLCALQDAMSEAGVKYTEIEESLIVAPDSDGILRETSSLCLDDSEYETSTDMKIVHGSISSKLALALGVKTKRRKCFDELSCLIPAGQKEKLVNRLRSILNAYPCDEGIMKELLQNADDAQATEIHFIKDYRTHGCKKIFDDKFVPLQGPALCVFNNRAFTKADIEGIHNLGLGSKREDPLKTGQYGVGFNAVYHLTDAPSFLTKGPELDQGEMLCIFDPSCQFLPKVTEQNPGVQCMVSKIRRNYPDVLKGYLEKDLWKSTFGTMFRFPLRNKKPPKMACISQQLISQGFLNKTLKMFCHDSFEALLFLKHVCKITVSNISSGKLREEYKVETVISAEDKKKRDEFFFYVKNVSDQYKKDRTSIITLQSREVGYSLTVSSSCGRSMSFYVVQRIGFKDGFSLPETVVYALKGNNIGQLPLGGVAVIIANRQELTKKGKKQNDCSVSSKHSLATSHQENSGRTFCFLPLPLKTGLPCHINGHFVLDHEARRSLWKEDKGYRHDWNHSLFEGIISPTYVAALLFLKQHIFKGNYKMSPCTVNKLLDGFHSHFPLVEMAKEEDFKAIVKSVYCLIVKEEVPVFPVIREVTQMSQEGSDEKAICLDWTALRLSGHRFPAYFHQDMFSLAGLLKNLGMKLIDSPLSIKESVDVSVNKIAVVSPNDVEQFIKSYNSLDMDKCVLEVNVPIIKTRLESVSNVRYVIEYIEDIENFSKEVNELPLLVTNDGFLRLFSSRQPVINSLFWDLFPHSSGHFLHCDLISSCQSQTFMDSGVFCDLTLQHIIDLLPSELSPNRFMAGEDVECNKSSDDIPNVGWIIRFWECVYDICSKYLAYGTESFDDNALRDSIKALDQWSLLPVQHSNENSFVLRSISKGYTMVNISSFDTNSLIRKALEKLDLPQLNISIFSERSTFVQSMVLNLVASKQNAIELLNCFYYHREKVKNTQLTSYECNSILKYFSKNITELRKSAEEWWIQDRIKALPLHITQHATSTSIDGGEKVFVLPTDMPTEGLGEWAADAGYILLQQNKNLEELHKLLRCTFADTIDVYCSVILPKFEVLQKCHHLQHLLFIKEKLLFKPYNQPTFNEKQLKLINVLKSTAFLSAGDKMKVASDLYDPYNVVFANMCSKDDFPASPFSDERWNEFLKLIGLKAVVTENMFLAFAKALAKEGAHCIIGKNFDKKSKILTEFFWRSSTAASWENKTIELLAEIKFIPPHIVSCELSSLCKQYSESNSPICFSKSIPASFEELCWTSMNLLPTWACQGTERQERLLKQLSIHTIPPVEKVILHCQNVCDFQNEIFESNDCSKCNLTRLRSFLDCLYNYLYENRDKDPKMKEKLQHTPLVFLPESQRFLRTRNIVIKLHEEEVLEPYLYKAPEYYSRYYNLFNFLGASKQVSLNHYFFVLESVMNKSCDKRLLPPDMIVVGKAIKNIVKLLKSKPEKDMDFNARTLYLLNRSEELKDARSLIVADNGHFEGRLSALNLDYFIGFNELEVDVPDPRVVIKALPGYCRPKLLSEVVDEKVDMTEKRDIESAVADDLESFLHCTEFVQGVLRLAKHEKTEIGQTFTKEDEERMFTQIQDIKIREIKGLYTYLWIDGRRIESSKLSKPCFIVETRSNMTGNFTLYFQDDEDEGRSIQKHLILQPDGVIDLIKRCTDNFICIHTRALFAILYDIQDRYNISNTLDRLHIDPYALPQKIPSSVFQRPGTYVPQEFHAFLEQGFSKFQKHEYHSVAYELEDSLDDSDDGESVYIYARIVRPVGLNEHSDTGIKIKYEIDIGDTDRGHIIVHAFKLFKFERKEAAISKEILSSDSVSATSLPFDETCHKIRIILQEAWTFPIKERRHILNRLLLKWHPDKNIGREEYCTRIFNYIQEVTSRLDNGQLLDNINVNHNNCYTGNVFTGTSYENLSRRVNRRSAQYREQHSRQENTFYQTHSRVHHAGQSPGPIKPAPDLSNATRWIKQAKKDLSSAKSFHPSSEKVPSFNWICYICHQATEKALKAAVYAIDANKAGLKSHKLANMASKGNLSHDLIQLATDLELCLGEYIRIRYPDPIYRTEIPALLYTQDQARSALEIAERVIELVDLYHFS